MHFVKVFTWCFIEKTKCLQDVLDLISYHSTLYVFQNVRIKYFDKTSQRPLDFYDPLLFYTLQLHSIIQSVQCSIVSCIANNTTFLSLYVNKTVTQQQHCNNYTWLVVASDPNENDIYWSDQGIFGPWSDKEKYSNNTNHSIVVNATFHSENVW